MAQPVRSFAEVGNQSTVGLEQGTAVVSEHGSPLSSLSDIKEKVLVSIKTVGEAIQYFFVGQSSSPMAEVPLDVLEQMALCLPEEDKINGGPLYNRLYPQILASVTKNSPRISQAKIQTVVKLITELGLERLRQNSDKRSSLSCDFQQISREPGISTQIVQALASGIIHEYGCRLSCLLEEFPFCAISPQMGKEALLICHKGDSEAIKVFLQLFKNHIQTSTILETKDWNEMRTLVENIDSYLLGKALVKAYKEYCNGDKLSGACFLVIIDLLCHKEAPSDWGTCTEDLLIQAIRNNEKQLNFDGFQTIEEKIRVVDLFFPLLESREKSLRNVWFLTAVPTFIEERCLPEIPFDRWPNKGRILTAFLKAMNEGSQLNAARAMAESFCDQKTQEIGTCLSQALNTKSTKDLYPILYRLIEILPYMMDESDIKEIFHVPFVRSLTKEQSSVLPTRRLNFDSGEVICHGNLIIGKKKVGDWLEKIPQALLAFDKTSDRLVWSIPLSREYTTYQMTQLGLACMTVGFPFIRLHNPESGDLIDTIPLPVSPRDSFDKFYITPSGFCYFDAKNTVTGLARSDGSWKKVFAIDSFVGVLKPLGSSCVFVDAIHSETASIINQDGTVQTLSGCVDVLLKNGKLYTIRRPIEPQVKKPRYDNQRNDTFLVTMQAVEEDILLRTKGEEISCEILSDVRFADVCDDGTIICIDDFQPCFIDLTRQRVFPLCHRIPNYSKTFVDTKRAAIWSWDEVDQMIWKHTLGRSVQIGKQATVTSLLHVDDQERLCLGG